MTVVWLIALLLFSPSDRITPYLDFSKAGAGFYGDGRTSPEPQGLKTVRIGVLGPAKTRDGMYQRMAVQLALEEANRRGGYQQKISRKPDPGGNIAAGSEVDYRKIPYEMVFREDDGPWGAAAGQVVKFAYEDKVWAIIGGLDGHHTHVAELVVSKAWIPVISPGAADASIDYANVPWVFRVVPADSDQASALLDLAEKRGYRHVVALTEMQREAYTGFLRLREYSRRRHYPLHLHLEYSPSNPAEIIPRLSRVPVDALLIWGRAESALPLLLALRKAGILAPVLAPASLATPEVAGNEALIGDLTVASPCDLSRNDPALRSFKSRFQERTGQPASAVALYSYDVACLVVQAIERGGLNRVRIRDRLAEAGFEGLTGKISFNSLGGNTARPVLMFLHGKRWTRLE